MITLGAKIGRVRVLQSDDRITTVCRYVNGWRIVVRGAGPLPSWEEASAKILRCLARDECADEHCLGHDGAVHRLATALHDSVGAVNVDRIESNI